MNEQALSFASETSLLMMFFAPLSRSVLGRSVFIFIPIGASSASWLSNWVIRSEVASSELYASENGEESA